MINFVDRSPTIKVDLPSCTLIVTLSLEQEVGIRILQHEKESSNRNQYKNPVKESGKKKNRNRIQNVSEESFCHEEEVLLIDYSFQVDLLCCLTDHAFKPSSYCMVPSNL